MKSSTARALSTCTVLLCWQHVEGELGELGEQLDDEDDGHDLGLDALDHPAPAAGLLLLVGHDFNVWKWLSSDSSQLTCQQQNIT